MKQINFLLTASLLVLAFSPLAMAQAPRVTLPVSETQLESAPDGPFQATWESIENNYQVPEWFKMALRTTIGSIGGIRMSSATRISSLCSGLRSLMPTNGRNSSRMRGPDM